MKQHPSFKVAVDIAVKAEPSDLAPELAVRSSGLINGEWKSKAKYETDDDHAYDVDPTS